MSGCQGMPWSEELDDKELHGALDGDCDPEPRGSAVSCTSSTRSQPAFQHLLQVWYYAYFKGVVSGSTPCTAALQYSNTSNSFVSFLADCAFVHTDSKICVS